MRQSGQQNLGSMLLLAQNKSEPPTISSTTQVSKQSNQLAVSIGNSSAVFKDTTLQNKTGQYLTNKEEFTNEDLDLSKKLDEMSPLMASAATPEPQIRQLPVNSEEVKSQIDYNQVFLEPFLDGGKKKYIKKPEIDASRVSRTVWKQGEILVKVVVDQGGNVEDATILRGLNVLLDHMVLEILKNYKYQAGKINGKAVRFTTNEVFRFE